MLTVVTFKNEANLPDIIDWVRANAKGAVVVVVPGDYTPDGNAHVAAWYNKQGSPWTQDDWAGEDAARLFASNANLFAPDERDGWFAKLEWHFEDKNEGLNAKLTCG